MPSTRNKRKAPPADEPASPPTKRRTEEPTAVVTQDDADTNAATSAADAPSLETQIKPVSETHDAVGVEASTPNASAAQRLAERQARFASLKAAQSASRDQNRKETAAEAGRLATDPSQLTALARKKAIASHKLLKAETAAEGDDFERKRAWDWTIDESEKWDRRLAKKEKHREDVAFQDYRQEARKVYKRQLKQMGAPDLEAYERQKAAAVERAAASGRLEVVETDDGELVAVDKDGTFYSSADSTDFIKNRPDKEAIDRLVADINKADDMRMKKRKERSGRGDDDGDITFINEKNKVCPRGQKQHCSWSVTNVSAAIQHEACKVLQQIHAGHSRQLRAWHSHLSILFYDFAGRRLKHSIKGAYDTTYDFLRSPGQGLY